MLREQYESWLKKRSDELKTYVEEFEHFKSAKNSELQFAESEIISLYKYVAVLSSILQNMESGY